MEVDAQFLNAIQADSKVSFVTYKVGFNDVEGTLQVAFPFATLFPYRNELFQGT